MIWWWRCFVSNKMFVVTLYNTYIQAITYFNYQQQIWGTASAGPRSFFRSHFFSFFCDFGVPRAPKIGAFGVHFDDFFVIGWISENDALARVSARSGRSWGLPKSLIFDVFWGTDFRCFFRTLFFRVLVIFSDFWGPSGLPLDLHWDEK